MKLITHLSWLLRVLLFLAVFAFALMNTDPVTLRFFLGWTWETPMILDAMTQSLVKGQRIEIRGFGSFGLNHRPARVGRNPKSGERVHVPEKFVPHFKAGKELRERVDQK